MFDVGETQFDLRWRMLGTDVRVSPWFWLLMALFGWGITDGSFPLLIIWVLCAFVSILVHEFGHVLMGRVFGTNGHIVLYGFGGIAIGSSDLSNRWQRVAVYLAGPGAGFLLLGVVMVTRLALGAMEPDPDGDRPYLRAALAYLFFMNLWWGILNLLPIYPLDGGQVSRDVIDWLIPGGTGLKVAFGLSMGVGIVLAILSIMGRQIYMAFFFGLLAFGSFQLMQAVSQQGRRYEDDRLPWERDRDDDQRRW